MKRFVCLPIVAMLCCLMLTGCWNYQGIDTLDIVTGIAIDKNDETGNYRVTFEIINTHSGGSDGPVQSKRVESEAETIFEAIRYAKKRLINRLYTGNTEMLIISRQIAETEGIFFILEEFLRDGEARETLYVAISEDETANAILLTEGIDSNIISYEIYDMITEDKRVTGVSHAVPLYQVYNQIKGKGGSLVLPVLRSIINDEKVVAEAHGVAFFKGDRLIDIRPSQDAQLYLFIINDVQGGAFSITYGEKDEITAFEIKSNQTQRDVHYEDGRLSIFVDVHVKLNMTETKMNVDFNDLAQRAELESMTADVLKERIASFLAVAQQQMKTDVFGFGRLLYLKNPDLYRSLENQWDELFQNAAVSVNVDADIMTTGVLKSY